MAPCSVRQPAQRLTARQIARQERLLQGIHQTRWDDMQLPRGLDLTHKTKQKTAASEEQHLKKMKAAEVRRVRTQKARKDTMEITKARIRAATSKNFRDMVENNQTTKGKVKKRPMLVHFLNGVADKVAKMEKRFTPGTIKIKRRPDESIVILPPDAPLPHALTPRTASGYPRKRYHRGHWTIHKRQFVARVCRELSLDSDFRTDEISLGMELTIRSKNSKNVAMKGDLALGFVKSVNGGAMDGTRATLTTIWRQNGIPRSIGIAIDSSKSDM